MSNIAIIDADIVGKKKHRFPNLCCMKISAYHKKQGDSVCLKTDYEGLGKYDKVYISKVFVDTEVPGEPEDKSGKTCDNVAEWYENNDFLKQPNIEYGGTGFFYDKAPPLPDYIEHIMPDYNLYDSWVSDRIANGDKRSQFTYYLDYSIGYLTRECFRGCSFCVNRNYKSVRPASLLCEFMDPERPKICLLDDNFFGCPSWRQLIQPVIDCGKRFQFKQGLDERLLTVEKVQAMLSWKYDKDFIFAFDNIEDKDLIESKLRMFRDLAPDYKKNLKFYVFCGFDRSGRWDDEFWEKDIKDLFERIHILKQYGAIPYIMRYEAVHKSEHSSFYASVAAWCNQPSIFKKFTFRMFSKCRGMGNSGYAKYKRDVDAYLRDGNKKGATWREMDRIEEKFPEVAARYFDEE